MKFDSWEAHGIKVSENGLLILAQWWTFVILEKRLYHVQVHAFLVIIINSKYFPKLSKTVLPFVNVAQDQNSGRPFFLLFISYDVLILLFYSRGRDKIRIITFLNEGWIYCFDKPLHRGVVDPAITGHRHYWLLLGGLNASKSTIYNT